MLFRRMSISQTILYTRKAAIEWIISGKIKKYLGGYINNSQWWTGSEK